MPDDAITGRVVRFPLDVGSIAARAEAAPGGFWAAFPDSLWIPFSTDADDPQFGAWDHGRYITVRENDWHAGSADPGPELWEFLAAARGDVLALAAEVQRLRAALAAVQGQLLERAA